MKHAAFLLKCAAAAVFLGSVSIADLARAQEYPSRFITLVVASAPGGPADTGARIIVDRMSAILGQQIVIENMGGAGGTTGAARVARAEADGYTLLIHQTGITMSPALFPKLSYDVARDLTTIGMVSTSYSFLIGRKSLPPNDFKGLLAWMKGPGHPAKIAFPGPGSLGHLTTVLFAKAIGTDVNAVPYRGIGPAVNDLVGGHIDLVWAGAASSVPLIKAGTVKGFAYGAAAPSPLLPELPSIRELGYRDVDIPFWHALFAPAGTPRPIIEKLNAALRETLADPQVKKAYADAGLEAFPADKMTPEGANAYVHAELKRWAEVIRENNIQAEP